MKRITPCGIFLLWAWCATTVAAPAAAAPVLAVQQGSTAIGQGSIFTFPSTPVGIGSPVIFTISNTGNQTLTISNPSSLVTGSGAFGETVSAPSSIAAGGSGNFRIRLLGGSPGTATATVSIQSNDPVHGTFSFTVQGTITGPVLSVAGVAKGSTFTFPNSTPAGTATSVLFTINNTGTTPLNLGNPSTLVSGAAFFEIVSPATPVAAGGSTVFRVRLYSTTAGTFTGTVSITSDDPNNSPYTFNLQGTVTPPPAPILSVAGVPKGSTFVFPASTPVGVATSVVFTINNTGSAPLNLSNAASLVSGGTFFEIANPTTPVAAGSSTTFRVRLYGTTPGTFTGTVSIQSDDPNNNPYTFTVQGTITGPILSVTAGTSAVPKGSTFVFPASTPVGVSTSVLFTINNTGSTPLNLGNTAGLVSGGDFFEIASPTTPVAAGGSTTCRVRLYGTTPGTFTGTVSIQSDDANGSPYTFTVQGTITGPILSVTAGSSAVPKGSTFVFPATTPVGVSTSVVFTINNTGSAPLNLSNAASLVSGSTFFEIANPTTPVAAGGSTSCRVRLYGTTPGTFTGTVSIQSDDANGSPYTFTVQGTITGPILSVTAGSSAVPKGSTFVFPASTPAGVATSVLFTINNTGSAPLNLSNAASLISCTDFFEILNPTTPVAAGGSTIFRIRLYGTTPGTFTCTVSILSDDPNDSPYTFTIQGTITPAAVIGVQLGSTVVANGSTVTFPSTPVGVGSPLTFTITDTGSTTLSISNPTTLVSGNAAFGETVNAPASVNAGGNGSFRVRLLGGSPGNATGTVTIQSNDPVTPTFSFTIQGTVNSAPRITVQQGATAIANGSTFTFPASTPAGTPETVVFSLVNAGTAALNLGNAAALVSGTSCSETQVPVTPVAANGGSTGFAVQVLAATGNTYTCTVTIASDDPIYPSFSFTVVATVNPAPHLRVVQAWNNTTVVPGGTVTFPDVAVGTAESLQLLLVNDGPGTLTLANPTALVGGACYAELDPAPAATINAGQSAGVRVRLECGTAGLQTGTFSASSNDPLTPVYSFNLSGAVGLTLPPLRVESGDGVFVAHEGSYAFPDTGIGQKVSRGFTIFNDGAQDFVIANPAAMVSGDAGFSQSAQPASATVPAGGSQTFRVQLLSSQVGAHYGEVTIASADPTQNPFLFGVSGTVQAPDFMLSVTPTDRGLTQGQNVGYQISMASLFGFNSTVSFSLTGLDSNSSFTFAPPTLTASGSSQLRIFTSAGTPTGTQTLTLTASGGGVTHTVTITLLVQAAQPATLTVTLSPATQSIQQGGAATFTVVANGANLTSNVTLAVTGLPASVTASFDSTSPALGQLVNLSLATTAATPLGSYPFTVTATAGALASSAGGTLTVQAAQGPGAPSISAVSPNVIVSGQVTTLTLTGQNLQNATVSIPTSQALPNQPQQRTFPTASLESVSADGTSMQVSIDATDQRILDFYNLEVTTAAGKAVTQFRVLPPGPIIDDLSPGSPAAGTVNLLTIVGAHLRNVTLTASPASIDVTNLDATEDDRTNGFVTVPASAPPGNVVLTVTDIYGRSFSKTITIVAGGQRSARAGERVIAMLPGANGTRTAIYFQPFQPRRLEATRVLKPGVLVEEWGVTPVKKDFTFGFSFSASFSLLRFHWQTVILQNPITHVIGANALQGLGLQQTAFLAAYVFSLYTEIDATVYWNLDSSGDFTFPEVCFSFVVAAEVPGLVDFPGTYNFAICGGGSGTGSTTGSTVNMQLSADNTCAQVTQSSLEDGLAIASVTQNQCCNQPIGITASGDTFIGTYFNTSFNYSRDDIIDTSPDPAACKCPCTIAVQNSQLVLKPGDQVTLGAVLTNTSTDSCTYNWTLSQTGGALGLNVNSTGITQPLAGGQSANIQGTMIFPPGAPATDGGQVKFIAIAVGAAKGCEGIQDVCGIPTGETSDFKKWCDCEDIAQFQGNLLPATTDFTGRTLTEVSLGHLPDTCAAESSQIPVYDIHPNPNQTWTAGSYSTMGSVTANPPDGYGADSIGTNVRMQDFVGSPACDRGATQQMNIQCPWGPVQYKINQITMHVDPTATTITRDGTSAIHLARPSSPANPCVCNF